MVTLGSRRKLGGCPLPWRAGLGLYGRFWRTLPQASGRRPNEQGPVYRNRKSPIGPERACRGPERRGGGGGPKRKHDDRRSYPLYWWVLDASRSPKHALLEERFGCAFVALPQLRFLGEFVRPLQPVVGSAACFEGSSRHLGWGGVLAQRISRPHPSKCLNACGVLSRKDHNISTTLNSSCYR